MINPIFRFGLLFSSAIFSTFGLPNDCQIVAPAALPIAATIDMVNVINIWVEFPMLSFILSPPIKETAFSAEMKRAETPTSVPAKRKISMLCSSAVVPQIPDQNPNQPETSGTKGEDNVQDQPGRTPFLSAIPAHGSSPFQVLSFS